MKKNFICFFKEFYSLYWSPSRRSATRFLFLIPGWNKLTGLCNKLIKSSSESDESQSRARTNDENDQFYREYFKQLEEDLENGKHELESLCPECKEKCCNIWQRYYPRAMQMREENLGADGSSFHSLQSSHSSSSERALSIIGGMCRRVVLHCNGHYCEEADAADFFQEELNRYHQEMMSSTDMSQGPGSNEDSHDSLESPSTWNECPPDISRLFQRRHRAPIAYWLAYISTIDETANRKQYARYRGERMRFMRLMNSIANNKHKSGLERFARILMFGNMSVLNRLEREPKKLEDVFPDLDGDHCSHRTFTSR